MGKGILQVIAVLLLLILLAVTNPSKETHRKAIEEKFSREHEVVGLLGGGIIYSSLLTYNDYVFFSVTKHEGKIKSVGLIGMVFTI